MPDEEELREKIRGIIGLWAYNNQAWAMEMSLEAWDDLIDTLAHKLKEKIIEHP